MSQPAQNLRHARQFGPLRKGRSVDHQHRHTQRTCGVQLSPRTGSARVLGHNQFDIILLYQRPVPCLSERSARHDHIAIRQRQRIGFVHQPQQVSMLGLGGEFLKMHTANGQKNAPRGASQSRNRRVNIRHMLPTILALRAPCRARQRRQGHLGLAACCNGIRTHLCCEGMGGINHMGDRVILKVPRQTFDTAEPTDTYRQGLGPWIVHPTGIGIDRRDAMLGQNFGQRIGLGRATKDQEVGHA